MLLLSINHLFTGRFNDDKQSADLLRDDIEKKDDVITDNSIFKGLVTPEHKAHGKL